MRAGQLLVIILVTSCSMDKREVTSECRRDYNEIIIDDLHRGKYLVSVPAIYKDEKFKIIIDSFELHELIKQSGRPPDTTTVNDILSGTNPLELTMHNIDGVSIVRAWKDMDKVLTKGKDYSLEYFFNGHIQKKALSDTERNQLIEALVDWCMLVYVDDETGRIKILDLPEYHRIPRKP
jgi:3',5'-cyclic AMP phosphodiesterase CpdA